MKYEVVIGLEVHVELATESKLFCTCSAKFGADQNEHVCPACAGLPGLLPVANRKAIELGMVAAIVTNSEITRRITFDKKNYFYPDLGTGYQITQWFAPICRDGYVDIVTSKGEKRINLKQIHIEEDAGKLVHDFRTDTSLVDYNRAGVPLVEIVSKPEFRSAEEVIAYLEKLKALLTFAGVSDCKMQEGSMRCDVNISVREAGTTVLGTRTEMKNMNSLKAIVRAIDFEAQRHIDALETGCEVLVQETRRWDDERGESYPMRSKENATDYRYFPNPDIMPIEISDEWLNSVRSSLPELAHEKYTRLTEKLGLSDYDARSITASKNLSDIFDGVMQHCSNAKEIANWLIGDLFAIVKAENRADEDIVIDCERFGRLISMVEDKRINRTVGKKILALIYKDGIDPEVYVKENQLGMVADTGLLEKAVSDVLAENPKSVEEYKAGNPKVMSFLMGKVMRQTGGKADPAAVSALIKKALE